MFSLTSKNYNFCYDFYEPLPYSSVIFDVDLVPPDGPLMSSFPLLLSFLPLLNRLLPTSLVLVTTVPATPIILVLL